ncbi:MAG: phosphatase PAP2 family protein [Chloroflexota bacterium]|nr:MAG: phosphatase PAP2 family protein [Chloroflexota bacterium]
MGASETDMTHLVGVRGPMLLIPWVALLLGAMLLALVAQMIHTDFGSASHVRRIHEVRSIDVVLLPLMTAVSFPGYAPKREILLVLGAVVPALRRQWGVACLMALTITGDMLALAAKLVFAQPRSEDLTRSIVRIYQGGNGSAGFNFPSGHVVHYVVFFGTISFLLWRGLHSTSAKHPQIRLALMLLFGICVTLILFVGASQVYLGYHSLNDVLGGYIVGALWLWVLTAVSRFWLHADTAERHRS